MYVAHTTPTTEGCLFYCLDLNQNQTCLCFSHMEWLLTVNQYEHWSRWKNIFLGFSITGLHACKQTHLDKYSENTNKPKNQQTFGAKVTIFGLVFLPGKTVKTDIFNLQNCDDIKKFPNISSQWAMPFDHWCFKSISVACNIQIWS